MPSKQSINLFYCSGIGIIKFLAEKILFIQPIHVKILLEMSGSLGIKKKKNIKNVRGKMVPRKRHLQPSLTTTIYIENIEMTSEHCLLNTNYN